ncbi:P-loop containing nucleoside triphosphate hydrolase protein [Obelidium mucronatum]|nr:P-loop containing nucleoside triphosphate hydrolase protein [Obelidium mucronatum]
MSTVHLKVRPRDFKPGDILLASELDISNSEISNALFAESGIDRSSVCFSSHRSGITSSSALSSSLDIPVNPLVENVGILIVTRIEKDYYDSKRKRTLEAVACCTVHHFPSPSASGPPLKLFVSDSLNTTIPLNRIYASVSDFEENRLSTSNLKKAILDGKFDYAPAVAEASHRGVPVEGLNPSQQKAHDAALATCKLSGVCLIQGPPGTGKTKTVSTIICSILSRMQTKILQCAPTNIAMIQVGSRLVEQRMLEQGENFDPCEIVILGHRDKVGELIDPKYRQFCLEIRLEMVVKCVDALVKGIENIIAIKSESGGSSNSGGGGGGNSRNRGRGRGNNNKKGSTGNTPNAPQANQDSQAMIQRKVDLICKLVKDFRKEMVGLVGERVMQVDFQLIEPFQFISRFVNLVMAFCSPGRGGGKGVGKTGDSTGADTSPSQQMVLETAGKLAGNVRPLVSLDKFGDMDQSSRGKREMADALQELFMDKARAIFSTLNGTFSPRLKDQKGFNVVIVDEAAQATEAETTCVLRNCVKALILVGDTKQLESTVMSEDCKTANFGRSLVGRLEELKHPKYMLETQYRMHPRIAQFSSKQFYDGWLINSTHVEGYSPPWYKHAEFPPVQFIAHSGTSHTRDTGGSSSNELEAKLICAQVSNFYKTVGSHTTTTTSTTTSTNKKPQLPTIGIITPYKSQKSVLESHFLTTLTSHHRSHVTVNTVDGFQGQERDVIILSLTRVGHVSGFLDDLRRVNVSLTRAKFNLWVFGDERTFDNCLGQFGSFGWFYSHCVDLGFVKSVSVKEAAGGVFGDDRGGGEEGGRSGDSYQIENGTVFVGGGGGDYNNHGNNENGFDEWGQRLPSKEYTSDEEGEEESEGSDGDDDERVENDVVEDVDIEDQQEGRFVQADDITCVASNNTGGGGYNSRRGGRGSGRGRGMGKRNGRKDSSSLLNTLSVASLESSEQALLDAWSAAL